MKKLTMKFFIQKVSFEVITFLHVKDGSHMFCLLRAPHVRSVRGGYQKTRRRDSYSSILVRLYGLVPKTTTFYLN